jgi:hypothetical protein
MRFTISGADNYSRLGNVFHYARTNHFACKIEVFRNGCVVVSNKTNKKPVGRNLLVSKRLQPLFLLIFHLCYVAALIPISQKYINLLPCQ